MVFLFQKTYIIRAAIPAATPTRPRFWELTTPPLVGAREAEAPADPVAAADPVDREAEPEAREVEPVRVVRDAEPEAPEEVPMVPLPVPLETPAPTMEVVTAEAVEDSVEAASVEVLATVEATGTVVEELAPEVTGTTAEAEEVCSEAEEVALAEAEAAASVVVLTALPPVILN